MGLAGLFLAVLTWTASSASGAEPPFDFATDLFPRLEVLNCRTCHNASGVASGTRLHFPEHGESADSIRRFGLGLETLVNRDDLTESPLLLKPTNRIAHTGGSLIVPDSDDERMLFAWIKYLATLEPARAIGSEPPAQRHAQPLRRLTHAQYDDTVRYLLGDQTKPARSFPTEDFVNGYSNQASSQSITAALAEAYGKAAEKLARNAFRYGDQQDLIPCSPKGIGDEECARAFVESFGAKAYRRPLTTDELRSYTELTVAWAAAENDFLAGATVAVETMLQSPHFLFLVPLARDSALKQWDTASRLSYALWNTLPDSDLFEAAASRNLESRQEIEAVARRMLERPVAIGVMDGFFAQWMRFDRLRSAVKDRNRFRDYSPTVAESMTEESLRLFRHLAWNDLDFREFFNADYTFVDDFLTTIYGMPDPRVPFGKTSYGADSLRGGILGHGTYLAQTGKPINTSPTERGLFIREHFLCQTIPPPPPGVDASLPPLAVGARPMTIRMTMESLHAPETACASCHKLVDPIGFGFEHFDTVGAYREEEPVRVEPNPQQERQGMKAETHHLAIDSAGYIAGIEDSDFSSPREAGRILARSETCQKCVVKQLFRYFFGRHETKHDADLIQRAYNRFRESGFLFRELVLGLLVTEEFLGVEWSG